MTSAIPLEDGIWWIGVKSKLYYQVSIKQGKVIRRDKLLLGLYDTCGEWILRSADWSLTPNPEFTYLVVKNCSEEPE